MNDIRTAQPVLGKPLLSICIPTMDRGELLEIGLRNLLSETEPFGDEVEVIVTDNGSDQDLEPMVHRASARIKFKRFPEKVVFPRSILYGPRALATGKFIWIIGDDDVVVRGSLGRILQTLRANPGIEFFYLNHGWISRPARNRQILENDSRIPEGYDSFQCVPRDTRILPRLEDLIDLANTNPYALFSTIFCYIARRDLYLDYADLITPLDEWDDAVQTLDNMFPHSKMLMTAYAGKPVGYIGDPCFLQGGYPRQGPTYVIKTMVYGTRLLLSYLEGTAFAPEALAKLWQALAYMAGRMTIRFQDAPEENLGWDILLAEAFPYLTGYQDFWDGLFSELKINARIAVEGENLGRLARKCMDEAGIAHPRIAIWGARGRGEYALRTNPWLKEHTRILVDAASWLHGQQLTSCGALVQAPEALCGEPIDLLLVATRMDFYDQVFASASALLAPGTRLVNLLETRTVQ